MADKVKMSLEKYEEMKEQIRRLDSQAAGATLREAHLHNLLTKIGIPSDVINRIDSESVKVERLEAVDFSWPSCVKHQYVVKFMVDGE